MDCHHENGHDHAKQLDNEAGKYQAEMINTIPHHKSGKLDWETNEFKLTPGVTRNGASAPEPIQLTTDALSSGPM